MTLVKYEWIIALISIAFCVSSFGNGANDVSNSYASSVAARTLTMPQVGFLSMITEFTGAVALGSRVTSTIKNGIITISRFEESPGTLILGMGCAETGSAFWLILSTAIGFPVSTTQTVVGALIGVGIASGAPVKWGWSKGSVSQIAASWGVSPAISGAFSALIFGIVKYSVLERDDPLKWAMRLIPYYLSTTAAILALFIVAESPTAPSLEQFGAGKACAIVFGVFFGVLAISYIFFIPYFKRRIYKKDARLRFYHIPLGPLLLRDDPPLYWPGDANGEAVIDYYKDAYLEAREENEQKIQQQQQPSFEVDGKDLPSPVINPSVTQKDVEKLALPAKRVIEPEEIYLDPYKHLPLYDPKRIWSVIKFIFLQGVTRECVSHNDENLAKAHALAKKYDNNVEHLWTYCQVASAMMMSIAHGSNDVANAVGPWVAAYNTYITGMVTSKSDTPIWILVIAGFLLGAGFWFFGYHIIRSLGNKITQLSPTRGFSMELGAAITVLLASRLGLPVSTTQCLTGSIIGVALMNYQLGAVNWRQLGFIFIGWLITLPSAGLISGLLMAMALNTPHF